jgi:hypothetical protein
MDDVHPASGALDEANPFESVVSRSVLDLRASYTPTRSDGAHLLSRAAMRLSPAYSIVTRLLTVTRSPL